MLTRTLHTYPEYDFKRSGQKYRFMADEQGLILNIEIDQVSCFVRTAEITAALANQKTDTARLVTDVANPKNTELHIFHNQGGTIRIPQSIFQKYNEYLLEIQQVHYSAIPRWDALKVDNKLRDYSQMTPPKPRTTGWKKVVEGFKEMVSS